MCRSSWTVYGENKDIEIYCEGTEGVALLPVDAVIYASVEETGARGPMLVEAMTEVEKMDLRLTVRGPASAKCESLAPAGFRCPGLRMPSPGRFIPWLVGPQDCV